jgi:hypothetical protein
MRNPAVRCEIAVHLELHDVEKTKAGRIEHPEPDK